MRIEPASDIDASLESMNLMGQGRADWCARSHVQCMLHS